MASCPRCEERVYWRSCEMASCGDFCWQCDSCEWHGPRTDHLDTWGPEDYRREKERIHVKWRERILRRDGRRCRACGAVKSVLQVAHIKPALGFVKDLESLEGLERSYSHPNLVTLCEACHTSQHKGERDFPLATVERLRVALVKHLFYAVTRADEHISECVADCPLPRRPRKRRPAKEEDEKDLAEGMPPEYWEGYET